MFGMYGKTNSGSMRSSAGCRYSAVTSLYTAHTGTIEAHKGTIQGHNGTIEVHTGTIEGPLLLYLKIPTLTLTPIAWEQNYRKEKCNEKQKRGTSTRSSKLSYIRRKNYPAAYITEAWVA